MNKDPLPVRSISAVGFSGFVAGGLVAGALVVGGLVADSCPYNVSIDYPWITQHPM